MDGPFLVVVNKFRPYYRILVFEVFTNKLQTKQARRHIGKFPPFRLILTSNKDKMMQLERNQLNFFTSWFTHI